MRLYSRTDASSVQHEDFGSFDVDADGVVEVPDAFGVLLHRTHFAGRPAWESDAERTARLVAEEIERRKDPATLLAAVEKLTAEVEGQKAKPRRARPKHEAGGSTA